VQHAQERTIRQWGGHLCLGIISSREEGQGNGQELTPSLGCLPSIHGGAHVAGVFCTRPSRLGKLFLLCVVLRGAGDCSSVHGKALTEPVSRGVCFGYPDGLPFVPCAHVPMSRPSLVGYPWDVSFFAFAGVHHRRGLYWGRGGVWGWWGVGVVGGGCASGGGLSGAKFHALGPPRVSA
jgi:hypothetical protein